MELPCSVPTRLWVTSSTILSEDASICFIRRGLRVPESLEGISCGPCGVIDASNQIRSVLGSKRPVGRHRWTPEASALSHQISHSHCPTIFSTPSSFIITDILTWLLEPVMLYYLRCDGCLRDEEALSPVALPIINRRPPNWRQLTNSSDNQRE